MFITMRGRKDSRSRSRSRSRDSSRPREKQSKKSTDARRNSSRKADYSDYSDDNAGRSRTKAKSSAPAPKGRRGDYASDYSDDSRDNRRRGKEPPKRAEPSHRDASPPMRRHNADASKSAGGSSHGAHDEKPSSQPVGRRRFTEQGSNPPAQRSEETPPNAPKKKPRVRRTQQLRRELQLAHMIKEAEEAAARQEQGLEAGNGSYNDERSSGFSTGASKEGTKLALPNPVLAQEPAPAPPQPMSTEPSGGRQIAVRGVWAEFATSNNRTYWMNVVTKEKTWLRPAGVQGSQDNQPRTGATVSRDAWSSKNPNMLSGNHGHIFVGGMPQGMNEMIFKQSFERFGKLVSMTLYTDRGYGFCQYATAAEARAAVEVMHKSHFYGTRIMCKLANLDGIR